MADDILYIYIRELRGVGEKEVGERDSEEERWGCLRVGIRWWIVR